jgi:exosome complex component RRP41
MTYTKRNDGRKFEETRELKAEVGVIKNANGSAKFQIGSTVAVAAVYGPRNLYPRFLQNPERGVLRCNYNMLSFSVDDRIRPGPSRRSKEISLVTERALEPSVNLKEFPNAVVDVFVEITQADAGTRCAGICAASMALADAGIPMKDLVVAVSVGKVGDKIVVDLDKFEEDYEEGATDLPIAVLPRTNEISLLQMDGEMEAKEIKEALEMGLKSCEQIYTVQKEALKRKYRGEENANSK